MSNDLLARIVLWMLTGCVFVFAYRVSGILWSITAYYRDIWATKAKLAAKARQQERA